jgi:hypothetical protein
MHTQYPDKRKAIAGEFFLTDSRLKNRSKKAFKKIQTWKSIVAQEEANETLHQQVENLVRYSFFQKVSTSFILLQERFYERPNEN